MVISTWLRSLLHEHCHPVAVANYQLPTLAEMSKKECPSCAMQIDADAEVCPVCEYEFPSQTKYQWIVGVMIVVIIVTILFLLL